MNDWLRSLTVLGVAFVAVAAVTLGVGALILHGPPGGTRATDATAAGVATTAQRPHLVDGVPTRPGGTLAVSGDRDGLFMLTREAVTERYALVGDDGRITFEGRPPAVVQVSFDGLEFFPEPDACSIATGELNQAIGVAAARLECAEMADIRGNGSITLAGTIGLPGDLLGLRGDLPASGGTIDVGGETLEAREARLFAFPQPAVAGEDGYDMELVDDRTGTALNFSYDHTTHRVVLVSVERGGTAQDVTSGACSIATREIGRLNPRIAVVELSLECPGVDVPGLGRVPIIGSVVVEQIEAPA